MKKIFFIAMVLLTVMLSANVESCAQNDHLKFAGIPLDGSISNFHQKLLSKGYSIDPLLNDGETNQSRRCYKGVFAGEKCTVIVYFDLHTKIVYRVKVLISGLSESIAEQKYSDMKARLIKKYDESNSLHNTNTDNGLECFTIIPMREKYNEFLTKWGNSYGEIDLYRAKNEADQNYPYHFYLHIDYLDQINSDAHEKSIEDDL